MTQRIAIKTQDAPQAIGPYSQGIRAGGLLFCSGQIPLHPATHQLVEGDVAAQTRQVMQNLRAVLKEGGASFADGQGSPGRGKSRKSAKRLAESIRQTISEEGP